MKLEIPVAKEDEMVGDINLGATTMTFTPYVGIFEDGLMVRKVALLDGDGDALVLSPNAKEVGNSNKNNGALAGDYFADNGNLVFWNDGTAISAKDTLDFGTFLAYFPTDVNVTINAGSRYSTNYFLEPLDGTIQLHVATGFTTVFGTGVDAMSSSAFRTYNSNDLKKLITRLPDYTETAKLDLTFLATEDFLPHNSSDMINIQNSIAKTTEDTIYDVLLRIAKRFNCNFLYDYDDVTYEHILRVDPIHIARSGSLNIDTLFDDTNSVKISEGGSRIKDLTLRNENYDSYYDDIDNDNVTIGSTTQTINAEAKDDKTIKLDSSIFFKSTCGQESFDRPTNLESGAFSSRELGLASNIHAKNSDIGFRFAYVKAQNYTTNLLHPFIVFNKDVNFTGAMKSETERIYTIDHYVDGSGGFGELSGSNAQMIFNGELTHVNGQGWDLRAEDEAGVLTDYYALYSAGESLIMANNSVIEFDMVVETADIANLDYFLQTMTAPSITPNNMYVKSAEGEVFGEYAYLTIKALID